MKVIFSAAPAFLRCYHCRDITGTVEDLAYVAGAPYSAFVKYDAFTLCGEPCHLLVSVEVFTGPPRRAVIGCWIETETDSEVVVEYRGIVPFPIGSQLTAHDLPLILHSSHCQDWPATVRVVANG